MMTAMTNHKACIYKCASYEAGVKGVAVPDAGWDGALGAGEGTVPKGSFRYSFKKLRQLALEGTK